MWRLQLKGAVEERRPYSLQRMRTSCTVQGEDKEVRKWKQGARTELGADFGVEWFSLRQDDTKFVWTDI